MAQKKIPVIVSGFWQFLRFALLVSSSIFFLNPPLRAGVSLLVVLLAAPSLVFAVACILSGTDSRNFLAFRELLIFGKALEIIPALVLLVFQGGAVFFGIAQPVFDEVRLIDELSGYAVDTERVFYYGLAGMVLVDLIFLLVLLSYGKVPEDAEPEHPSTLEANLPDYSSTEIEEEE